MKKDLEIVADSAFDRLTERYINNSPLNDLTAALRKWYLLSEQDAKAVINYLNEHHLADMGDMGYIKRFVPEDFLILLEKPLSLKEFTKNSVELLHYIGLSIEQGEWLTLNKPLALSRNLVTEGIFEETEPGYRISEQAIYNLARYCGLTQ